MSIVPPLVELLNTPIVPHNLVSRARAPELSPAISTVGGLGAVSQKRVLPAYNMPEILDGGPVEFQLTD